METQETVAPGGAVIIGRDGLDALPVTAVRGSTKAASPVEGNAAFVTTGGVPAQLKESPQAQEPVAFGLSIVKPCFSIVSTKSTVAPLR